MRRRNLFDIQEEYMIYMDELEEYLQENPDADGEIPDHIYERLSINKNEVEQKLTNYNYFVKELEAEQEALKAEIKRLQGKVKSKDKTVERLKMIMSDAVKLYGEVNLKSKAAIPSKVIEGDLAKFTFIYNPKLEIKEEALPMIYQTAEVTFKHMTRLQFARLFDVVKTAIPEYTPMLEDNKIVDKPNKALIEEKLEEGAVIPGASINYSAGYVKIS